MHRKGSPAATARALRRPRLARLCASAVLAIVWLAAGEDARAEPQVDLQLVLAVDSSASVDAGEFALQMAGIAAAFRDAEVVAAAGSGPLGRIAVAAMFWAESGWDKDRTPWHVIDGPASAEAFARLIERYPRRIEGGTGIGHAVLYGVRMIEGSGFASERRVIDVSGDGRETTMREFNITPGQARIVATSRGITVNGLAMLSDEPGLGDYYRREVVGGFGSFVITASSIDDFARAMRLKLLREIEHKPIVSRNDPGAVSSVRRQESPIPDLRTARRRDFPGA